jgi:hypothetical protein
VEVESKVGRRVRKLRVVESDAQMLEYELWAAKEWVPRGPIPKNVGKSGKKYFRKNFSFLNFWRGWWKISGRYFAGEIGVAVRAIAEGLVGGMAAAAESDGGASGETEFISGEIDDFKIAFY